MKQSGTEMTLPPAHKTKLLPTQARMCVVLYLLSRALIYESIPCYGTSCSWMWLWLANSYMKHQPSTWMHCTPMGSSSLDLWLFSVGCGCCGPKLYMRYHPTGSVCWTYYQSQVKKGSNLWWVHFWHPPTLDIVASEWDNPKVDLALIQQGHCYPLKYISRLLITAINVVYFLRNH